MGLRKKKAKTGFDGPDFAVLTQRAQSLETGELIDALENSISAVNRYISEYRRTRDATLLEELKMSAEAFYVMADVLAERSGDAYGNPVAPARQRGSSHY